MILSCLFITNILICKARVESNILLSPRSLLTFIFATYTNDNIIYLPWSYKFEGETVHPGGRQSQFLDHNMVTLITCYSMALPLSQFLRVKSRSLEILRSWRNWVLISPDFIQTLIAFFKIQIFNYVNFEKEGPTQNSNLQIKYPSCRKPFQFARAWKLFCFPKWIS